MRAMDVMTTDVITVDPERTVQALATLLAERGISGAPVVDASGRLVGIVSEGDLLHRAEIGTARRHRERRRSWWLDHFAAELARDYVKSHGRTVKDIMTRDVVTVTEDTDLGEVAALLEADQTRASHARWQSHRHYQPGQPRPRARGDKGRATARGRG